MTCTLALWLHYSALCVVLLICKYNQVTNQWADVSISKWARVAEANKCYKLMWACWSELEWQKWTKSLQRQLGYGSGWDFHPCWEICGQMWHSISVDYPTTMVVVGWVCSLDYTIHWHRWHLVIKYNWFRDKKVWGRGHIFVRGESISCRENYYDTDCILWLGWEV